MTYALQTEKLTKEFGGVRALNNLTILIPLGNVSGIVGPNGSGKSTLVNLLTGVHRIDGGTISVGSTLALARVKRHKVLSLGLSRTFQNIRLFEQISVLDNILVVVTNRTILGSLFERKKKMHAEKAQNVLERVGLWGKRNELAKNLSYGQRKLLEIARVLATDTDIVLLDEPFAGLFPEMVKIVSSIIKELRDNGKTVILIEHDMALIRELCDHVIVLDAGTLLAEGKPEEVLADSRVVEAYLGV